MCSQVYKRTRFQKIKDRDAFTIWTVERNVLLCKYQQLSNPELQPDIFHIPLLKYIK